MFGDFKSLKKRIKILENSDKEESRFLKHTNG